jgi:PAS domain S-box-containing protein
MTILLVIVVADLTGILLTLTEERRINASFQSAVTSNLESNSKGSAIHELASLAGEVAPSAGQTAEDRTQQADTFFARLDELRSRPPKGSPGAADWSRRVDQIASQMRGVTEEAALMSALSRDGNPAAAQAHWEELHRRRNLAEASLHDLDESIQNEELGILLQMADVMPSLARLQNIYTTLIVVLLLVIGGGFYRVAMQLVRSRHRDLSEERLKLATNATTDVIWDWSVGEDRAWCNERFAGLTGQQLAKDGTVSLVGWYGGIHPDDLERVQASLAATLSGGAVIWSEEYRLAAPDATYRFVLSRAQVIRDSEGTPLRLVGAISDMTEHRLAEKRMADLSRQNEMILNTAGDGIFGVDMEGRATFVNPASRRMTGFTLEQMGPRTVHATLHRYAADGSQFVGECPSCDAVRDGVTVPASTGVFWRVDGTALEVEYTITPMRDDSGETVGAVVIFRDDSQRRAVEKMKDEFISVVSHELRTPLTSIRGALGLLASGLMGKSPAKGQRMLDLAVSNTERLIRLINDILDIERIDSGRVTLVRTRIAAAAVLREVADLMAPIAEGAEVRLDVGMHSVAHIWADSDRVVQTLTNLVSNAVKFSPPGTTVNVTAVEAAHEVTFSVRDEGRGIPAEKFETIFERFQQVDASDSRDKGGSGLGLTICRSIVRQHGGEIRVESVMGSGSAFHFTIPTSRSAAASPSILATPPTATVGDDEPSGLEGMRRILPLRSSGRQARILVVEDDADLARVICESFESQGIRTAHAPNGRDAVALSAKMTPDLVILDLALPDLDGFAVVKCMRAEDRLSSVPLVVYSATEPTPEEKDRLRLGPTEFMTKSRVRPEEFERRVVELLSAIPETDAA